MEELPVQMLDKEKIGTYKLQKKQLWTTAEHDKLSRLLNENPEDMDAAQWAFVASQLPGRSARQCKERYLNTRAPKMTDKRPAWTPTEDLILLTHHAANKGYIPSWTQLALKFDHRSHNDLKNHWNASFRSKAPEIRPESLLCTYIVALREGLSAPDALQEACAKWARTNKVALALPAATASASEKQQANSMAVNAPATLPLPFQALAAAVEAAIAQGQKRSDLDAMIAPSSIFSAHNTPGDSMPGRLPGTRAASGSGSGGPSLSSPRGQTQHSTASITTQDQSKLTQHEVPGQQQKQQEQQPQKHLPQQLQQLHEGPAHRILPLAALNAKPCADRDPRLEHGAKRHAVQTTAAGAGEGLVLPAPAPSLTRSSASTANTPTLQIQSSSSVHQAQRAPAQDIPVKPASHPQLHYAARTPAGFVQQETHLCWTMPLGEGVAGQTGAAITVVLNPDGTYELRPAPGSSVPLARPSDKGPPPTQCTTQVQVAEVELGVATQRASSRQHAAAASASQEALCTLLADPWVSGSGALVVSAPAATWHGSRGRLLGSIAKVLMGQAGAEASSIQYSLQANATHGVYAIPSYLVPEQAVGTSTLPSTTTHAAAMANHANGAVQPMSSRPSESSLRYCTVNLLGNGMVERQQNGIAAGSAVLLPVPQAPLYAPLPSLHVYAEGAPVGGLGLVHSSSSAQVPVAATQWINHGQVSLGKRANEPPAWEPAQLDSRTFVIMQPSAGSGVFAGAGSLVCAQQAYGAGGAHSSGAVHGAVKEEGLQPMQQVQYQQGGTPKRKRFV